MPEERKPKGNHLISYRKFVTFVADHPGTENDLTALRKWGKVVEKADWRNFADVRDSFPHADLLPDKNVCFNVGGNKYRVIAEINYRENNTAEVLLREVLTHGEYDKRQ